MSGCSAKQTLAQKADEVLDFLAKGERPPKKKGAGKMKKQNIFSEIKMERERQDKQWGGKVHDDIHSVRDWVSFIVNFLGRTVNKKAKWGCNLKLARVAFIKVAALSVAAIEAIDRKLKK